MIHHKGEAERKQALRKMFLLCLPSRYLDYRQWLVDFYECTKETLGSYSYIQFSADLGFGENNVVHLITRSKRNLTLKSLARMVEELDLKGKEVLYLETLVEYSNSRKSEVREKLFQKLLSLKSRVLSSSLDQNQLEYYREWYHPVVREMVAMPGFKEDPHWIADRIVPRILPEQARKSLELLRELGLVEVNETTNQLFLTQTNVTAGDEVAGHAIVRYHQRVIELARDSITRVDADERDISAVTVGLSDETFQNIKNEIQQFRKHILRIAEQEKDPARIYQINFQLFPFSKKGE